MSESEQPSEDTIESLVKFIRESVKNEENAKVDYRVKNNLNDPDLTNKLNTLLIKNNENPDQPVNYIRLGKDFYNKEIADIDEGISEVGSALNTLYVNGGSGRKSRKTHKKKSKASKKKKSQRRRKSNRKSRRR